MALDARGQFYFLITLWGRSFVDLACKFAIASLLAPNNIPAMRERESSKFLFCIPRQDWNYLQTKDIFQRLKSLIEVEQLEDEAPPDMHKYVRMSRGHALLTERCFKDRAKAININPDSVYPDGSVAEAQRLSAAGKKVVLCTAIRFDLEGVEAELRAGGMVEEGAPLNVSKRDAVRIGLKNLHPESSAADWTAPNFGRLHPDHGRRHFLTCCLWRTRNSDAAVVITHNWSPFLIDYSSIDQHDVGALDGRALDGNYIFENFSTDGIGERIHVVDDSDSLFLLGLTPRDEMCPPKDSFWWKNAPIIGNWTRGYILNVTVFDSYSDELRRRIYGIPVKWHSSGISSSLKRVQRRAESLIRRYVVRPLDKGNMAANPIEARWRRYIAPLVADL
jgi:hypothetical protein